MSLQVWEVFDVVDKVIGRKSILQNDKDIWLSERFLIESSEHIGCWGGGLGFLHGVSSAIVPQQGWVGHGGLSQDWAKAESWKYQR